ncbi:MAG TPA: putative quinol monooxygenase [Candidatus Limnocylindria bacterium]|jgi:quinol monooxygenase YgiN|nr:putative quinol monooxygenase [Candidatus Limnocylindria bacterium]
MAESKVTVIARIRAKADRVQRVEEELRKLLAPTRAENGCINFDMHQGATDPSQFLFHENWTSKAALEAHFETPHIKNWLRQAESLLAEPLEVTLWNRVG